ncbi:MAG: hypothetical protein QNJ38_19085, partial [Prochloraceae cyanobacterium]|nr:hypothetical protein [Prochloraceae cyanobacterium]
MYWHKLKLRQLGKKIGQAIATVIILFACNPKSALAQANVCLSSQQGGLSGTGVTPFISGEVGPNGVANRDAAITLDDSWRAAVSGLTGFNNFQTRIDPGPDTNIASPFQLLSTASGANVDVFVSSLDMTDIDTCLGT